MSNPKAAGKQLPRKIVRILGTLVCVVLCVILVCNLSLIIKGAAAQGKPPSIFGVTPLITLSGSMSGEQEGHIEVGDLILVTQADAAALKEGDVITFMEGSTAVTHRIIQVETSEEGALQFITKGDANNVEDTSPVTVEQLVGQCTGRIPGLGHFALFLQKPEGLLICLGIPLVIFIIIETRFRRREAKAQQHKQSELEAELERLRSQVAENSKNMDV